MADAWTFMHARLYLRSNWLVMHVSVAGLVQMYLWQLKGIFPRTECSAKMMARCDGQTTSFLGLVVVIQPADHHKSQGAIAMEHVRSSCAPMRPCSLDLCCAWTLESRRFQASVSARRK